MRNRTLSWITIVIACLALTNLIATATQINWKELRHDLAIIWRGEGEDSTAVTDRQYQPIREALRELDVHGRVGYITDLRPGDEFLEDYYLTQYALLPLIVEDAPGNLPYVVGNFYHPETDANSIPNLQPVVTAGRFVLFRRRVDGL